MLKPVEDTVEAAPTWLANACGACAQLYTSGSTGKPKGMEAALDRS